MKYSKNQEHENQNRGRAFKVTVTETYERTVTVYESELKEPTMHEAIRQVEEWWNDSQIELTTDDFQGVEFSPAVEDNPSVDGKNGVKR